eukprot:CAMPEP_0185843628 /NCGR_PEP_ID=MMETSP1354-20130828/61_1 /TAXON_ID=708628 /ORGANISM="Erythrolobus madagascarensis, Strain CCMP3276" /LENGTH=236 /DNA_ID=CAMNT_0028543149 /DNA_START=62 /DNA_END=772 /DNA_ORIENTATION=+
MAKSVLIAICSMAVLFVAVAAQKMALEEKESTNSPTTCACEAQKGTCQYIFETEPGFCKWEFFDCEKCVCVEGGSMTCVVSTGAGFALTDPGTGACEIQKTLYAECPSEMKPTPTPTPTPTPNLGNPGWYLAALGESCDQKCSSVGSTCNANQIQDLNSVAAGNPPSFDLFMAATFSYICPSVQTCATCNGVMPGTEGSNGSCRYSTTQAVADCADSNLKIQRVCCCGDASDCPIF